MRIQIKSTTFDKLTDTAKRLGYSKDEVAEAIIERYFIETEKYEEDYK